MDYPSTSEDHILIREYTACIAKEKHWSVCWCKTNRSLFYGKTKKHSKVAINLVAISTFALLIITPLALVDSWVEANFSTFSIYILYILLSN